MRPFTIALALAVVTFPFAYLFIGDSVIAAVMSALLGVGALVADWFSRPADRDDARTCSNGCRAGSVVEGCPVHDRSVS